MVKSPRKACGLRLRRRFAEKCYSEMLDGRLPRKPPREPYRYGQKIGKKLTNPQPRQGTEFA